MLKWKPKYIGRKGLEMALRKTILWFKKNDNLKKYSKEYKV